MKPYKMYTFGLMFAALLSGCCGLSPSVKINDEPLWYIKGLPNAAPSSDYAVQMYFLSSPETEFTKAQFDAIPSQGLVCMKNQSFEDFNTTIGELCSNPHVTCDYAAKLMVDDFMTRLRKHVKTLGIDILSIVDPQAIPSGGPLK